MHFSFIYSINSQWENSEKYEGHIDLYGNVRFQGITHISKSKQQAAWF